MLINNASIKRAIKAPVTDALMKLQVYPIVTKIVGQNRSTKNQIHPTSHLTVTIQVKTGVDLSLIHI